MKSTAGRAENLQAQVESTKEGRLLIQGIALEWVMLAKGALPNATPLAPEELISINEYFWSHFK